MLLLARVLETLALVLAVNLSGIAHHLADVVFHDDAAEQSPDDDADCPPGCPTCHSCAHARAPYVPRAPQLGTAPITVAPPVLDEEWGPPTQSERASIFRPPRALPFAA